MIRPILPPWCFQFTQIEARMPPCFPQRGHGNREMKGLHPIRIKLRNKEATI